MQLNCRYLPQTDGESGWYDLLLPPEPAQRLQGDQSADWIVLGAGLAGLAAARRLAELAPHASIALIEARRVGEGAAGRNSGFLIDLPHDLTSHSYTGGQDLDRQQIRLNRSAIEFLRGIVQRHGIDCDWREQGKLHGAVEERGIKALKEFSHCLTALGEPFTELDAADMKRITGTSFYRAGMHAPGCVLVQPAALVRGLARTLPENVTLYEDSPVRDIELGPPHCMTTAEGRLRAPKLVMANNAYASQLPGLGLKGRVLPVYTFASLTRPMSEAESRALGGEADWALIPADPMGTTLRRLANGRICVRNCFAYLPSLKAGDATLARVQRAHRRSFQRRFPMLEGMEFTHTWGGALCLSRNGGVPFGQLAPGVFSAICQNGLGLTRGTLSGKLIAEFALGEQSDELSILLKQPWPCRNPPEPLLGLGVRSSIAWKEWQAGVEL